MTFGFPVTKCTISVSFDFCILPLFFSSAYCRYIVYTGNALTILAILSLYSYRVFYSLLTYFQNGHFYNFICLSKFVSNTILNHYLFYLSKSPISSDL